jgi:hypothetical protein
LTEILKDNAKFKTKLDLHTLLRHDANDQFVHALTTRALEALEKDTFTLEEARNSANWKEVEESIRSELSDIQSRQVFETVKREDVPHGAKIFNLLLLLKRKRDKHNEISKYKARLVMEVLKQRLAKMCMKRLHQLSISLLCAC